MSYANGPKIVTDGLVCCLDAANRKSYPGSGSTWYDLSGNEVHGTLNATYPPTFSNAYGGVFDFDGINDIIQVPDVTGKTDFSNTNDYSICFWVKVNYSTISTSNTRSIMEKWDQSSGYPYVVRYLINEKLNTNIYNGTSSSSSNSTSVIADTWAYVCYSVSWNNNNSKLYINSNMEDSQTLNLTGTIENNSPLYIGARGPATLHCKMLFANLTIYNKALSANEVLQNYNATKGRFATIGSYHNPAHHSSQILSAIPSSTDGVYWFDVGYGPIPIFCDMTNGGWMMMASNNASDTTIPGGTSRNTAAYRLDRNGTTTYLGTPSPDKDYIIGQSIQNLDFSSVRIYGFGRTSINGTYTWGGSQGSTITAEWNLSTTGDSRFTEIVPAANVTFGGNTTKHVSAAYYILDAVRNDISFNANNNQSTVGAAGVGNANGDPSNGTYIGHGSTEGSYEGWYILNGGAADAQGYTTWVK